MPRKSNAGQWTKGQSGNPYGKARGPHLAPGDARRLIARRISSEADRIVATLMAEIGSDNEWVRIAALKMCLEYLDRFAADEPEARDLVRRIEVMLVDDLPQPSTDAFTLDTLPAPSNGNGHEPTADTLVLSLDPEPTE
jgi:hypothetical protein